MANTHFSGPVISENGFQGDITGGITGDVTGDVTGAITPTEYDVAGLPAAADNVGLLVYCSDGGGGSPCLAYSNGTIWSQIAIGLEVSAN